MGRSHTLRVYRLQLIAHFGLACASAPRLKRLTSPRTSNSPDHYAKGTPSAAPEPKLRLSLRPLVSTWFQVLFHSPPGVLFTFPSRYWFTIGRQRVFSLGGWSLRIPAGLHVSRGTWERIRESQHTFVYRTFTVCGLASQPVRLVGWFLTLRPRCPRSEHAPRHLRRNAGRLERAARFRLFPVRSPLLRESRLLSLPGGTEMFHFPPLAT